MEIFNYFLYGLGWLMVLLVMYVILFKLYYMGHRPLWLYPAALVFVVLDYLVNLVIMSVLMLDPPKSWLELVTDRMKRYKASADSRWKGLHSYRYHVAENLCLILNVFDKSKGGHC